MPPPILPDRQPIHPVFGEIVVSDPSVCGGSWVFRGTEVTIERVLTHLSDGVPVDEIAAGHATLVHGDLLEFLSFLPFVVPVLRR